VHAGTALRFGLAFDRHCVYCCASLTALLLANGVMDLRAMALVTVDTSLESLSPGGTRVARVAGDRTRVKQRVCASATSRPACVSVQQILLTAYT
jgi:predicted metal-binding membrane protein